MLGVCVCVCVRACVVVVVYNLLFCPPLAILVYFEVSENIRQSHSSKLLHLLSLLPKMLFPALVQLRPQITSLWHNPFSERLYKAVMKITPPLASLSLQFLDMTEGSYVCLVKHVLPVGLAMKYALYVSISIALLLALRE